MNDPIYRGVLTTQYGRSFLLADDGTKPLDNEKIWEGYLAHWSGKRVCARRLQQRDYDTGKPIVILWPDEPVSCEPFIELYFNERLVKYPASRLGHLAVNVSGEIFNFSHRTYENEVMRHEDYFYRPALGEFAPHPETGRDNLTAPEKPYYDKFGRLFMRTIYVLRLTGVDSRRLAGFFHGVLNEIHSAPPDPRKPGYYSGFNLFTRNCATFIRNGFSDLGFSSIRGIFPREVFISASYYFLKQNTDPSIQASSHVLRQLMVPQAAKSALPPMMNPVNWIKYWRLAHNA